MYGQGDGKMDSRQRDEMEGPGEIYEKKVGAR